MTLSNEPSKVPIKNLYYMLVYAWDHPYEKNLISVYEEDEKDLINLLSKVLIGKVQSLIKRGFYKEYMEEEEESDIIRGKILFQKSINTFSYKRGRMHIQHEEMSTDILHNQIIKATLFTLLTHVQLERKYKEEIKGITAYFTRVSLIKLNNKLFQEIRIHRNNQHYKFILQICRFLYETSFLNEGERDIQFHDLNREHYQLARLFESFVKNFYRKEITGSNARSESLYWPAEGDNISSLPKMKTDISLEVGNKKFIIDTKFYKDTFSTQWYKETVRSSHLYQLFAYLKNDEYYTGNKATGILLYPRIDKDITWIYHIHEFEIIICTLDLMKPWKKIHERLLDVINK
ncbi:5-methylcytosine restriction system specificity protein McrC [Bacillus sp. FJAT-44742]|uniref:5-methylcytosine restriction system specificity protein McrC n=1 Tax=Bacillus sp. FJAT-44742 TaxID=2014005 RepID=UPI000C23E6F3|nr:restriction endonuclease [Bacillus sp. FJAT-44742]